MYTLDCIFLYLPQDHKYAGFVTELCHARLVDS